VLAVKTLPVPFLLLEIEKVKGRASDLLATHVGFTRPRNIRTGGEADMVDSLYLSGHQLA
jgi:hypothetical protein